MASLMAEYVHDHAILKPQKYRQLFIVIHSGRKVNGEEFQRDEMKRN